MSPASQRLGRLAGRRRLAGDDAELRASNSFVTSVSQRGQCNALSSARVVVMAATARACAPCYGARVTDAVCSACRTAPPTAAGRCPVCGTQWQDAAAPRGDPTVKLELAVLGVALLGAMGWVGWTYRETFAQDPGMIGLVAFCSFVGVLGGVGKLMGWKQKAEQARDLLNP